MPAYIKPEKYRKTKTQKAHAPDHPGYAQSNGLDGPLSEPVPEFLPRDGDGIIKADGFKPGLYDNNTMIIFGRDRCGVGEYDTRTVKNTNSKLDYSDYMGAGAIDIVVGRGAPFPVDRKGYSLGPLFNTKRKITDMQAVKLGEQEVHHEGTAMDAARIYISQMTSLDRSFKISNDIIKAGDTVQESTKYLPYSGIMIKADQVRMHAREDIKIVTGGDEEQINSLGEPVVKKGIHLMAGNKIKEQQPLVLGDNLQLCLLAIVEKINQINSKLQEFGKQQMIINKAFGEHTHVSNHAAAVCTISATGAKAATTQLCKQFRNIGEGLTNDRSNLLSISSIFLNDSSIKGITKSCSSLKEQGEDFSILSLYNTTN
tara:strand:+ start:2056 stop:3168 length:1113 start_codon:yes stop_codon:yes gene_type:complete